MSMPLTIWNPIKIYKALRWDASLSAEQYLRASTALVVLFLILFAFSALLGYVFYQTNFEMVTNLITMHTAWLIVVIVPFVFVALFIALYGIKLAVMRLHAFNLSGWWLLGIMGLSALLDYREALFLSAIFYSMTTFLAYFWPKKDLSRWQYQTVFEQEPKKMEGGAIFLFSIYMWFTILGDPMFTLIDMM